MHEKEDAPLSAGKDDASCSSKVCGMAPSKEGSLPEVSRERSRTPTRASPKEVNKEDITKSDDLKDAVFVVSDIESSSVFVIEACAGSAMLSSVLQQYVDFGGNKHRPYVHVVNLDLRKRHAWEFLTKVVMGRRVFWFHGAPPCGTSSRARDRPLSSSSHGPPPLRSESHPLGLPCLAGVDLERVESANMIYLQMAEFCIWIHSLGIFWSLENPGNSYMWYIPQMIALARLGFWVHFHSCCHGGDRKKSAAFLTSCPEFRGLEATCDNQHDHAKWGLIRHEGKVVFATSKEAAYPRKLCERIAELLKMSTLRLKMEHLLSQNPKKERVEARAATGKQPKMSKWGTLISEFLSVHQVASVELPPTDSKKCLTRPWMNMPQGSRVLNFEQGKIRQQQQHNIEIIWKVGIYRTPQQFVDTTLKLTHPFDSCNVVDDATLKCIANTLIHGPVFIMKQRIQLLQKWNAWDKQLRQSEEELHGRMPMHRQKILADKKILLMQKIAESLKWPDMKLFDDLKNGFAITGSVDPSEIFQPNYKPQEMDVEELMKKSKFLKPAIWAKQSNQDGSDFAEDLWNITMEETLEKGWLEGPYDWNELEKKFNGAWLPVRRFAVWQREKWRPIDDLSENGVNLTVSTFEKVDLRALDETVWICKSMMCAIFESGKVDFNLSDGTKLAGDLHPFWKRTNGASKVLIKAVDLKSAYKRLPLAESDECRAVICVKNPKNSTVSGFVCKTLPFGAVGSVLHFNRFARFLKRVLLELQVVATNYFDDYPVITLEALRRDSDQTVQCVMKMLGIATSVDKELPFSDVVDLLGVTVDVSDPSGRTVKVGNKQSRTKEMCDALTKIVGERKVSTASLPSVFGRLQFMESQLLGSSGRLAIAEIRRLERSSCKMVSLDAEDVQIFELLKGRIESPPRTILTSVQEKPLIVFTDGACETEDDVFVGSVGAVIFDPRNIADVKAFGVHVPDVLLNEWKFAGKRHLIGPVEMYAVILARSTWKAEVGGRRIIYFVDHCGVMNSYIKGSSADKTWRKLLFEFEKLEANHPSIPWFCRVASQSNIADGPSRGVWSEMKKLYRFHRCHPVCPITRMKLRECSLQSV